MLTNDQWGVVAFIFNFTENTEEIYHYNGPPGANELNSLYNFEILTIDGI